MHVLFYVGGLRGSGGAVVIVCCFVDITLKAISVLGSGGKDRAEFINKELSSQRREDWIENCVTGTSPAHRLLHSLLVANVQIQPLVSTICTITLS